jgi:hypothetical protein
VLAGLVNTWRRPTIAFNVSRKQAWSGRSMVIELLAGTETIAGLRHPNG